MSLLTMQQDLTNKEIVYRSKIVNHPQYFYPVTMVEQGWSDGQKTIWGGEIKYISNGQEI
jgi:hypothetical protein